MDRTYTPHFMFEVWCVCVFEVSVTLPLSCRAEFPLNFPPSLTSFSVHFQHPPFFSHLVSALNSFPYLLPCISHCTSAFLISFHNLLLLVLFFLFFSVIPLFHSFPSLLHFSHPFFLFSLYAFPFDRASGVLPLLMFLLTLIDPFFSNLLVEKIQRTV